MDAESSSENFRLCVTAGVCHSGDAVVEGGWRPGAVHGAEQADVTRAGGGEGHRAELPELGRRVHAGLPRLPAGRIPGALQNQRESYLAKSI